MFVIKSNLVAILCYIAVVLLLFVSKAQRTSSIFLTNSVPSSQFIESDGNKLAQAALPTVANKLGSVSAMEIAGREIHGIYPLYDRDIESDGNKLAQAALPTAANKLGSVSAMEIAVRAIHGICPLDDRDFEVSIVKGKSDWVVTVTILPETPGAWFGALVTETGEVSACPGF